MFAPYQKRKDFQNFTVQPTKIHSRPTFLQLRKLERELTRYAANINSDRGGGLHGYIGLIKTACDYAQLSDVPFEEPDKPATTVLPSNCPGHESFRLQQEYHQKMDEYLEFKGVKSNYFG